MNSQFLIIFTKFVKFGMKNNKWKQIKNEKENTELISQQYETLQNKKIKKTVRKKFKINEKDLIKWGKKCNYRKL